MKPMAGLVLAGFVVALSPLVAGGVANASDLSGGISVSHRPPDDHPCPKSAVDPFCGMPDPQARYRVTPKDVG